MGRKDLDYSIYFVPAYNGLEHMWTLATSTAEMRKNDQRSEMYAPLVVGDRIQAFTLLKKTHPVVSEPVRKRDVVEIIGRDGDIDLYEGLLSKPIFERRTIEETFMLLSQNAATGGYYVGSYKEWAGLVSRLKTFFNGHVGQMRIVLSHDPWFYWLGRVTAAVDELEPYRAIVRITADVEPYKYERYDSAEPWIWDDFSFIDGIIREYGEIPVIHNAGNNNKEFMVFQIPMRMRDVIPKFRVIGEHAVVGDVKVSLDGDAWYDVPVEDSGYPLSDGAAHPLQLTGSRMPYSVDRAVLFKSMVNEYRAVEVSMRGATL